MRKTPLAEVFHFFPDNSARKLVGAKLTWEYVVDVGASSSSIPDNGARKLVGGTVMMYEINEVNDRPIRKPQEKVLMNIAASFPSVKKPSYVDQEKSRQYD
jgi:hypothetical protein